MNNSHRASLVAQRSIQTNDQNSNPNVAIKRGIVVPKTKLSALVQDAGFQHNTKAMKLDLGVNADIGFQESSIWQRQGTTGVERFYPIGSAKPLSQITPSFSLSGSSGANSSMHGQPDPRPLKTMEFKKKAQRLIGTFLKESKFPGFTDTLLKSPKSVDLRRMLEFLHNFFDEFRVFQEKTFVEDFIESVKFFGYPYTVDPKRLLVFNDTNYPSTLGLILWMVQQIHYLHALGFTPSTFNSLKKFENVSEEQAMISDHILQSYDEWIRGNDNIDLLDHDFYLLETQLGMEKNNHEQLSKELVELQEEEERYLANTARLTLAQDKHSKLCATTKELSLLIDNCNLFLSSIDHKIEAKQKDVDIKIIEDNQLYNEIEELTQTLALQPFSPIEIEMVLNEKQQSMDALALVKREKEEIQRIILGKQRDLVDLISTSRQSSNEFDQRINELTNQLSSPPCSTFITASDIESLETLKLNFDSTIGHSDITSLQLNSSSANTNLSMISVLNFNQHTSGNNAVTNSGASHPPLHNLNIIATTMKTIIKPKLHDISGIINNKIVDIEAEQQGYKLEYIKIAEQMQDINEQIVSLGVKGDEFQAIFTQNKKAILQVLKEKELEYDQLLVKEQEYIYKISQGNPDTFDEKIALHLKKNEDEKSNMIHAVVHAIEIVSDYRYHVNKKVAQLKDDATDAYNKVQYFSTI